MFQTIISFFTSQKKLKKKTKRNKHSMKRRTRRVYKMRGG